MSESRDNNEHSSPESQALPDETAELAADIAGDVRGMRVLTASEFSLAASIGGVRGLIEALAPGVVFVVVYVVTRELMPTLYASIAVALVAVALRLIQRTPLTQALSGIFGVAIGVVWAWVTKDANDYFAFGLLTNAAYLILCTVSILVGWPIVGVIMQLLTGAAASEKPAVTDTSAVTDTTAVTDTPAAEQRNDLTTATRPGVGSLLTAWRADRALVRRYAAATWLWVGLFGIRLVVQLPLFLDGNEVGWLGTARLVMGVPLWALTLWLTWVLVRQPTIPAASPRQRPAR